MKHALPAGDGPERAAICRSARCEIGIHGDPEDEHATFIQHWQQSCQQLGHALWVREHQGKRRIEEREMHGVGETLRVEALRREREDTRPLPDPESDKVLLEDRQGMTSGFDEGRRLRTPREGLDAEAARPREDVEHSSAGELRHEDVEERLLLAVHDGPRALACGGIQRAPAQFTGNHAHRSLAIGREFRRPAA